MKNILNTIIIAYCCIHFGIAQEILIHKNETWNYFDQGYLPSNWYTNTKAYSWSSGKAPLGYGDSSINTTISFGKDENDKDLVRYFRKSIQLDQTYLTFGLYMRRDDGIIVYINGQEAFRNNLPLGELTSSSTALKTLQGVDEEKFIFKILKSSSLKIGTNEIAVAVYQSNSKSSDLIFDMSLVAYPDTESMNSAINNTTFDIEPKEISKELASTLNNFEIDKIKLQNETLTSTNYTLKSVLFLLGILLFGASVGYFFMINNYNRKTRIFDQKIEELESSLKDKEAEMLQLSMNVLYNKQYFKEIRADIKSIKTDDKGTIKHLTHLIDSIIERDEEWEQLKNHFDEISSGFYEALIQKHPTLTETELRHCMFIKLHLQTKEIARILLIDPRSVQTARYRIKKSLGLPEEMDLRTYLLSL